MRQQLLLDLRRRQLFVDLRFQSFTYIQQDRAIKFAMAAQRVGDAIAAKML